MMDKTGMADEIERILEQHMVEDMSRERLVVSEDKNLNGPDSESVVRPIPVASPSYPVIEEQGELEGIIVEVDLVELEKPIEEGPTTPRVETPEDFDRQWDTKTSPSTYVALKRGVTLVINKPVAHDAPTVRSMEAAKEIEPQE